MSLALRLDHEWGVGLTETSTTGGLNQALTMIGLGLIGAIVLVATALLVIVLVDQSKLRHQARRKAQLKVHVLSSITHPFVPVLQDLPPLRAGDDVVLLRLMLDLTRSFEATDLQPALRLYAVWGQLPRLCELAKRGPISQRIQALTLMSSFEDQDTEDALVLALKQASSAERLAGMMSLSMRGCRERLGQIIEAMILLEDTWTADLMADILNRFSEEAQGVIQAWLTRTKSSPNVLAALILVLGRSNDDNTVKTLLPYLRHQNEVVRLAAVRSLSRMMSQEVLEKLLTLSADESPLVRKALCEALCVLPQPTSLACLQELINDAVWDVRSTAAMSLARHGVAGREVLRLLADAPGQVGKLAMQALQWTRLVARHQFSYV